MPALDNLDELMNAAKAHSQIASDRQLALRLGMTHAVISQIRMGHSRASTRMVLQLAELAGRDPEATLLDFVLSKARSDEERATWASIRQRIVSVILAVAICCFAGAGTSQAQTATASPALYIITN